MKYQSILFKAPEIQGYIEDRTMPSFFTDLNLNQIIQEILIDKEEYNLTPFFYQSLKDISNINYRLDVMKEFENSDLFKSIIEFSNDMRKVREYFGFSKTLHNEYQRKKWLLDAIMLYCKTIITLRKALSMTNFKSEGLDLFNKWLDSYAGTDNFKNVYAETEILHDKFSTIKYSIQIDKNKVVVNLDTYQKDYCETIMKTFESFNEMSFDYQINFFTDLEMCSLETYILEIVKDMNPDIFDKLDEYYLKHYDFIDKSILRFEREIQFYISYREYMERLKKNGFSFAYPKEASSSRINVVAGYDLALAFKERSSSAVVPNDFYLSSNEQVYILTGPNQGGKTTFARAFGQIHFLFSLGLPVPCEKAELSLFDKIFTHFSVEEDLSTNSGRLKEELARLKPIVDSATKNSLIIINELFATTTSYDAYIMGKKVLEHFISLDCICLYVTHIYELTQISERAVSLVAGVDSQISSGRTYKITRKPADGCAYANSIAAKYCLSYKQIKERIRE